MARPKERVRLTPELQQRICAGIRSGGFPQVTAAAAGVPREVFHDWLRRGSQQARQPYRDFSLQVREAEAQARLMTEIEVRGKDPKFWLSCGPGKETAEQPGWTAAVKPRPPDRAADNFLASPEWGQMSSLLLEALSPFPDARTAAAAIFPSEPRTK